MTRCYLSGWKTVTAPNQYDYLLGDVVPIGYGSNGSAELKNNFTLISLSIVSVAHLVSEEFWSHWLIMERFNAVWMVNSNREEPAGQTQSESESGCLWQMGRLFCCWLAKTSVFQVFFTLSEPRVRSISIYTEQIINNDRSVFRFFFLTDNQFH